MNRLVKIECPDDIFPQFRGTPVADLLEYQNLERPFQDHDNAEMLVGMCMDNRKALRIPDRFAYILRTGGGNTRYSEFKVSYAVAIGRVKAIALIAHNHCAMVNLFARKDEFIDGLVENGGWERSLAEEHFLHLAPMFEIVNAIDFVLGEVQRLRVKYPKIVIAPLFYDLDDNRLCLIDEDPAG